LLMQLQWAARAGSAATVRPHPTMASTPQTPTPPAKLTERELRAWRGMLRVHAALTKALDAQLEAQHGLPLTSYEVLMYLADAPGRKMRMSELAETILLSRSGLTRLVDRLERDGLICRESCDHDARGAFAKLTDAGADKLRCARATHLAGIRALYLSHLSDGEQELFGEVWERMLPSLNI
jgi:DNA-binding MarR family transcriptional regulator